MDSDVPDAITPATPDEPGHGVRIRPEPIVRRFGLIVALFHAEAPQPISATQPGAFELRLPLYRQPFVRRIGRVLAFLAGMILIRFVVPAQVLAVLDDIASWCTYWRSLTSG